MQRLTISLVVALVLTGCWAFPTGIYDSVTSLDSLDSFESATGLESDAGGATDGSEPTSEGGTEETGVVECVPTELPEAAPGYSPMALASGPDGTLYVGGWTVAGAAELPGCDPVSPGAFIAAFAPNGTCAEIWGLPGGGGEIWDIAVQGGQVAAVGGIADSAYLAIFDGGFDKPLHVKPLAVGYKGTAITGLGDDRWGVAGWCVTEGVDTAMYAEFTPGVDPSIVCHPIKNASQGWSVVTDLPAGAIYLAGIHTNAMDLTMGDNANDNHMWLKVIQLDPEIPLSQRVEAAEERLVAGGKSFRPRLALTDERLFIADRTSSAPPAFPPTDLTENCQGQVAWFAKQDVITGPGQALWFDPDDPYCTLTIDDIVADGDGVLIAGHTPRSFEDSNKKDHLLQGLSDSFAARIDGAGPDLTYNPLPLSEVLVGGKTQIVRQCGDIVIATYLSTLPTDPPSGYTMNFATSPL